MSRKTIAICVTGYDWENETRMIDSIYRECQTYDINILVFATIVKKMPINMRKEIDPSIVRGEMEIFNLINYDMIDGIIMLGDQVIDDETVMQIGQRAKEHGIPAINVNDPENVYEYNVLLTDKIAMEFVVRHLIQDHGLRKINFISGYPGNLQSEERLSAYKRVLKEFDIPYEEERVAYGEFWEKATACTAKFVEGKDKPEAIVCASDSMALFAMDYLKAHGYSVPEEIAVTGFDGILDAEYYQPSLTTAKRAFASAGYTAIHTLMDIWEGKQIASEIYVDSELVARESCGCKRCSEANIDQLYYNERYTVRNQYREFNMLLQFMNSFFAEATDPTSLYESATGGSKFFQLESVFINVCADIEQVEKLAVQSELSEKLYGLTDHMVSMFEYGHEVPVGTVFDRKDLLPVDILHKEKPCFMAFSPMYFKDRFIGYMAYEPSKTNGDCGDLFGTWLMQLSSNAGSFYMKNELQYVVKELQGLYATDTLTGLYNRRGLEQNHHLIVNAKKQHQYLTVVAVDVDGLKKVNDTYGHEGGDVVIRCCAQALLEALPKDAVCVRTGGDEMMAFFVHGESVDEMAMLQQIDAYLDDFNQTSGLPYKAGCSYGFYTAMMDETVDFDQMAKCADERMYRTKVQKKVVRVD